MGSLWNKPGCSAWAVDGSRILGYLASLVITVTIAACGPSPPDAHYPTPGRPVSGLEAVLTVESAAAGGLGKLDGQDKESSVRWLVGVLMRRHPDLIFPLIGAEGAQIASFRSPAYFVGYDNTDRIVRALQAGLAGSKPVCKGIELNFEEDPPRALVVFEGIDFPWHEFRMGGARGSAVGFHLQELDQRWRLVYITPIGLEGTPALARALDPCPIV